MRPPEPVDLPESNEDWDRDLKVEQNMLREQICQQTQPQQSLISKQQRFQDMGRKMRDETDNGDLSRSFESISLSRSQNRQYQRPQDQRYDSRATQARATADRKQGERIDVSNSSFSRTREPTTSSALVGAPTGGGKFRSVGGDIDFPRDTTEDDFEFDPNVSAGYRALNGDRLLPPSRYTHSNTGPGPLPSQTRSLGRGTLSAATVQAASLSHRPGGGTPGVGFNRSSAADPHSLETSFASGFGSGLKNRPQAVPSVAAAYAVPPSRTLAATSASAFRSSSGYAGTSAVPTKNVARAPGAYPDSFECAMANKDLDFGVGRGRGVAGAVPKASNPGCYPGRLSVMGNANVQPIGRGFAVQ